MKRVMESYCMNHLRKVKTQASSLVPLGVGPGAPLCFHTLWHDYVEICGIATGRLEYPLLDMNFSAQKTQAMQEEKQAPSASGFTVVRQREKCEKMCKRFPFPTSCYVCWFVVM